MTPERHAKIQEIFEAALDLDKSQRPAFLEEACGPDPDLRARVERLIGASEDEIDGNEPNRQREGSITKECPTCSRCYDSSTVTCSHDGTALQTGLPVTLLIDGKYLIEQRLGKGGMGSVFLAKHLALDRRFALKMILADGPVSKWSLRSFENEARALGQLKHPNIVDVTDYGVDTKAGDLAYLVMEYLEGKTLNEVLKGHLALPFPKVVAMLRAIALAIDAAHAHGIVHGDLKPSNLVLAKQGGSPDIIKVVDFGLARLTNSTEWSAPTGARLVADSSDANTDIRGTPAYMAPELFRRVRPSSSSDRFAFGVLTYEVLTGHSPFGRDIWEVRENLLRDPPLPSVRNSQLPEELDAPVLALLKTVPEDRPVTASAAVAEMEQAWLRAEQRKWREREVRRRFVLACMATFVIVFLAGLAARLDIFQSLENRISDARLALLPKHPPDSRIMLVVLDEATIAENRPPLADPAWADEFGQIMERFFAAGARGVGLDLLLPESWSKSSSFAQMIARRSDRLALALFSAPSGDVVGTQGVAPLTAHLLGADRYRDLFGFVNLREDEDRAIRHAYLHFLDRSGKDRASWASRAAEIASFRTGRDISINSPIRIDYSVRAQEIPKVSWKDVEGKLSDSPTMFRDKLVIVGADYVGSNDEHRVPATVSPGLLSGMLLQAVIINTIAEGAPIRDVGLPLSLLAATLLCFSIVAVTLRFPHRSSAILLGASAAACVYTVLMFGVFRSSRTMIPVVGPELAIIASIALAWCLKSYLSPYPTAEDLLVGGSLKVPCRPIARARVLACILVLVCILPSFAADCCKNAVAVVASLQGQMSARTSGKAERVAASTFEWLTAGAAIEVGASSSAVVILLNGHRYQLGAGAKATMGPNMLTNIRGPVHELAPLPPIPAPAAAVDTIATSSGAVRLRGPNDVRNLYPREGMSALPGPVNLSFGIVAAASEYRLEIEDDGGNKILDQQTTATHVLVDLKPGSRYAWRVRAVGHNGIIGEGYATFVTISQQEAEQRTHFANAVGPAAGDPFVLGLLAELDLRLGLLHEAQQGFRDALALRPGDAAIRRARELVDAALEADR